MDIDLAKELDAAEQRRNRIEQARQAQPIAELQRKADKARSKGYWTQEDLDYANARAEELISGIEWEGP